MLANHSFLSTFAAENVERFDRLQPLEKMLKCKLTGRVPSFHM